MSCNLPPSIAIQQLPLASTVTGYELVPAVQNGVAVNLTSAQIANLTPGGNAPSGFGGPPPRLVSSGLVDTASSTDSWIGWTSATVGIKTQNIPPGSLDALGDSSVLTITDVGGIASITYPIVLTGSGGATIMGQSTLSIIYPYNSITLKWDGVSNWIPL